MDKLTKGALLSTIVLLIIVSLYLGKGWLEGRADMEEEKQKIDDLTEQLLDERKDNDAADAKLAGQIEALRKQMSTTSAAAEGKVAALQAETEMLEAENKAIVEGIRRGNEDEEVELTEEQRKIREAPAIAKIAKVNGGQGFVIIDAGSAKGLESGVRFNIRRDVFIVGEIVIAKVTGEGHSIADIESDKIPQGLSIRIGDDVVSHPIY